MLRRARRDDLPRVNSPDKLCLMMASQARHESHLHIGIVLLIPGRRPELSVLRELVADRLKHVPALQCRLAGAGIGIHWEYDPAFDLDAHLREREASAGADIRQTAVADAREHPLAMNRPLWSLTLVHGYHDDEYALHYRVHHAFQDGISVVHTLAALFGAKTLAPPTEPSARRGRAAPRGSLLKDLAPPLRRSAAWSARSHPLTGDRVLHTAHLGRQELKAIARAGDATVNQVCLAAITGALRAWSPQDWSDPGSRLSVDLPVSLRSPAGDGALGNRVAGLRVALPCGEPSPVRQLEQLVAHTSVDRLVRQRETHRALQNTPFWITRLAAKRYLNPAYTPLGIAMLPFAARLTVAGAPVRDAFALPPLPPGRPVNIVLLQQHDRVIASFIFDAGIPDIARLPQLCQEAAARLHAEVCGTSANSSQRH